MSKLTAIFRGDTNADYENGKQYEIDVVDGYEFARVMTPAYRAYNSLEDLFEEFEVML